VSDRYIPRLMKRYREEVVPALLQELGLSNALAAPRLEKIVVNCGMGKSENQQAVLDGAATQLGAIAGQKPIITRARKSIAGFKLRAGDRIGLKVTLRGQRMYEFMDRLMHVAIPRVRDFRGLPATSFDKAGNYTMGLAEHTVFPEIDIDKVERVFGMDITFVIANGSREKSLAFLRKMGMPMRTESDGANGG